VGVMWQLSAGLGLALALSLGGFKIYYDKTEAQKDALVSQIKQASENQKLLESTIADQNAQLEQQREKQQAVLLRIEQLTEDHQNAMKEVDTIRKKFAKHNLDVLTLRKPKLIEKIINRGTAEVLNDLEAYTDPGS
jgi:multidrug resistance efflux pump